MTIIPEKSSKSATRQVLEKIIGICTAHPFKPDYEVFLMDPQMALNRTLSELETRKDSLIRTALYNVKVRKESNGEERILVTGIELPECTRDITGLNQEFQQYVTSLKQIFEKEGIPYREE